MKNDVIVDRSSAVDRATPTIREKHALFRGCRVLKRLIYRFEIELVSDLSF